MCMTEEQANNMLQSIDGAITYDYNAVEEIRYDPESDLAYVRLSHDKSRKTCIELCGYMDWAASAAPSFTVDDTAQFHASEFPCLMYKREA